MMPKTHIILGGIFTLVLYLLAPATPWYYLTLVFLASFLIDLDHYFTAAWQLKSIHPRKAFLYHIEENKREQARRKKGIRQKGHFHLFHTVEFHILIAVLGILWAPFYYIFIGMLFHSLLDLYSLTKDDYLYVREFFFFNWLRNEFL